MGEQLKVNANFVVWPEFQEESEKKKPDKDKDGVQNEAVDQNRFLMLTDSLFPTP